MFSDLSTFCTGSWPFSLHRGSWLARRRGRLQHEIDTLLDRSIRPGAHMPCTAPAAPRAGQCQWF